MNPDNHSTRRRPSDLGISLWGCPLLALLLCLAPSMRAQSVVAWKDLGNAFSTGSNWTTGSAPVNNTSSSIAQFGAASTALSPNFTSAYSLYGIQFTATAGSYTIGSTSGSTLTLGAGGISSSASVAETFAATLGLQFSASTTFTNNGTGTLTIGGTITESTSNSTLILDGTGNGVLTGKLTGVGGGLTKNGTGTWTLSGAGTNNYYSPTNINAGVLRIDNAAALGNAGPASPTNVASGAALQLVGGVAFNAEPLTLSGTGVANDGALRNVSGNNTWQGTVTLSGNARINSDGSGNSLTLTSTVNGAGYNLTFGGSGNTSLATNFVSVAGSLTYDGSGTLNLAGLNGSNYAGGLNINSGTVLVTTSNASAVGAVGNLISLNGGILQFANSNGSGINYGRAVQLNVDSTLVTDAGWSGGSGLTYGFLSLSIPTGGHTLNVIAGPNVAAGTTGGLTFSNFYFPAANGAVTTLNVGSTGAAANTSLTLGALSVSAGSAQTLIKTGPGTLIFNNASSGWFGYAADALVINQGTVQLIGAGYPLSGSAGASHGVVTINATTAAASALFDLGTSSQSVGGLYFGGAGATATSTNNITMGATGTPTLTLNSGGPGIIFDATGNPNGSTISGGTLALTAANTPFVIGHSSNAGTDLTITSAITGTSAGLTKSGSGTLALTGTNTYTGATTITDGTLVLSGTNGATTYNLNGGTLQLGAPGVLSAAASVAFNAASPAGLNLNNYDTTLVSLTFGGASTTNNSSYTVATGTGTLTLKGDITYNTGASAPQGAVISGNLALTNGNRTFAIADSTNTSAELTISANITLAGNRDLIKTGAGTLVLSGNNNYAGNTQVTAGTLRVNGNNSASLLTTVSTGATIGGSGSVGALTLNSGAFLSPGNSPGILHAGNTILAGGSTYLWQISDMLGAAGTGFDQLQVNGTLNITATAGTPLIIALQSLLSDNATPGNVGNYDPYHSNSYVIATASGGISGLTASNYSIDTSLFTNTPAVGWTLATSSDGNSLLLNYAPTAVPEPSTCAVLAGLTALGLAAWHRRGRIRPARTTLE